MFIEALSPLFARDLERLKTEIQAFPDGHSLWRVNGTITNSAGNLCLHLCGNLQHFIGAILGNTGYVRERDAEFSKRDVPAAELIAEIERTMAVLSPVLKSLSDQDMAKPFPVKVFAEEMSTAQFLLHLQGHLNYHLGQINYMRRME
jgi:uncharacterized damage-inducible protein DinB